MSSALISSADASRIPIPAEDEDVAALRLSVITKLTYSVGRDPIVATDWDWFMAAALAVRDHVLERWLASTRNNYVSKGKRVYYLSLEFLIGRLLHDSLNNLGLVERMRAALAELGVDYDRLRNIEHDAALGNGGLGRLAACFMESMATLRISAHGYGIRYQHGMFRQVIDKGWQREFPEDWLTYGNPWEVTRPDASHQVGFGGTVETRSEPDGSIGYVWHPAEIVEAVAYDTPVVGWRGHYVNTLRLWSARAADPLGLEAFNRGDHIGALAARDRANAISQVLYPSDDSPAGQELRLRQEYFFTSASLQDLIERHMRQHNNDIRTLPDMAAIQLNDTHPAIAVAELMRILVDLHKLPWDEAWRITTATIAYTNHTLLPEALESWPVSTMERVLPRHMQIVYQINRDHLDTVCALPRSDGPPLAALSLIDDNAGRRVRMSSLAFLGAHKVNGVSALHTELMRETVFRDLHQLYPDRIVNKTNGITFRRWLFAANPQLTCLLREVVGERLLDDSDAISDFARVADDDSVHDRLAQIRRTNKEALSRLVADRLRISLDPDALFDVHIKRIHEYKRQLLKLALNGALTIGTLDGANVEIEQRVGPDNIFIFGLTAEEAVERRRRGPGAHETVASLPALQQVLDAIAYGVYSRDEPERYRELIDELTGNDHFLVTADFEAYVGAQRRVSDRWHDRRAWWRSSVLNTAGVGWFSSDRAIREYAEDIWNVVPRTI